MIYRQIDITVTPTAQELAYVFAENDAAYQVEFFNELAKLVSKWDTDFCFQLQFITDSPGLNDAARHLMSQIGEYSKKAETS